MNRLIIFVLISLVIFLFILKNRKTDYKEEPILNDTCPSMLYKIQNAKLNVWMYCNKNYDFKENWKNPINKYNYKYFLEELCVDTFIKNMTKHNVNVIILSPKNVRNYVSDFPMRLKNSGQEEKKVVDLLGSYILNEYGGLWISPYTIVLDKDYNRLFNDIKHNDIVTFGTSSNMDNINSYNGQFNAVNNYIIGAKPHTPVIRKYKELMTNYASSDISYTYNHVNNYPEPLGESIMYTNPVSIHYSSEYDGSYNVDNRRISLDEFFGKMPIMFKEPTKVMFVSIPYKDMEYNTKYMWIRSTPMNQLLNSGLSIVKLL